MGTLRCTREWAEEDMDCGWKVGKEGTLRKLEEAKKNMRIGQSKKEGEMMGVMGEKESKMR